jgi:hypothetical protein
VRLLGIDAPEVRGLDLDKLEESKFLYVLDDNLLEYLTPKLTRKSIETHKKLGFKARDYLESILDENLTVTFGREVFDRYGRPLVFLGDGHKMYNVTLGEILIIINEIPGDRQIVTNFSNVLRITLVDVFISFVVYETLPRWTWEISAFKDLLYNFCSQPIKPQFM